jgi:hypothetical protein
MAYDDDDDDDGDDDDDVDIMGQRLKDFEEVFTSLVKQTNQ